MPFAHESDDVCLCQDGFLLRQKIHFAMAAACGFGTCVFGKFFVSGRTVCFYCSVVKSGKFCSRSRFRTDCGTVCTGIFDEIVFKRAFLRFGNA